MEANPYYLKDTEGDYYNKYPEFQVWEDGFRAGERKGRKIGFDEGIKQTLDAADSTFGALLKAEHKAGIKEVVEWIKDRIFYCADSPPQEGVAYGYLGNYILKFGKEVLPSVGFYELSGSSDWQAKLKEWGIEK